MKKIFSIVLCVFFLSSTSAFALTTSSFSINLPSDFRVIIEDDESGEYSNGEINISYAIEKSEFGEFYLTPSEIKDELDNSWGGLAFLLLGFSNESEVVEINNKEFLKDIREYEEQKSINYLTTTGTKLTIIKFSGENIDENKVDSIMSTIKLKGLSSNAYSILFNVGVYGVIALVIIGLSILSKSKKAKKLDKQNDIKDELETDGIVEDEYTQNVKDEWKL